MDAPDKLLIIMFGAIGDIVRALPLASRIKSSWPNTRIDWAVEPRSKGVLESLPNVDRLVVFERAGGLKAYREFVSVIKAEDYPLALDLQRHFKSGLTSYLTGAPKRVGYNKKGSREFNHWFNNFHIPPVEKFSSKTKQLQLFADLLGLPEDKKLDFGFRNKKLDSDSKIRELLQSATGEGFVAMLTGSTWTSRFWPKEYYSELIEKFYSEKNKVSVLIGGPGEQAYNQSIQDLVKTPEAVINLTGKTRLNDLPGLFKEMDFAVGSDSGPMHIAAASNLPVISLWGATSPKRSAPWGSEHLVIASNLACSPCYKKDCPGLGTACMKGLRPERVLTTVDNL